jgi:hypothetical protein
VLCRADGAILTLAHPNFVCSSCVLKTTRRRSISLINSQRKDEFQAPTGRIEVFSQALLDVGRRMFFVAS